MSPTFRHPSQCELNIIIYYNLYYFEFIGPLDIFMFECSMNSFKNDIVFQINLNTRCYNQMKNDNTNKIIKYSILETYLFITIF